MRSGHERTWHLLGMVRSAAEGDTELAALADRAARGRRADCEGFLIDVLGQPPTGVRVARRVDVLWAQTSVDVYRPLVVELRWTPARYESWLVNRLCRKLDTGLG